MAASRSALTSISLVGPMPGHAWDLVMLMHTVVCLQVWHHFEDCNIQADLDVHATMLAGDCTACCASLGNLNEQVSYACGKMLQLLPKACLVRPSRCKACLSDDTAGSFPCVTLVRRVSGSSTLASAHFLAP